MNLLKRSERSQGVLKITGDSLLVEDVVNLSDAVNLLKASMITAALTLEAQLAVPDAFDPLIGQVRAFQGHRYVSEMIRCLIAGSKLIGSDSRKVQDAYSLRCVPQVHGATANALDYVRSILEVEINSVNDNPLLFPEENKVLSGGNFHGQPVAQAMDFMAIAVAELASIAERRVERLVSPALSGLPPFLVKDGRSQFRIEDCPVYSSLAG